MEMVKPAEPEKTDILMDHGDEAAPIEPYKAPDSGSITFSQQTPPKMQTLVPQNIESLKSEKPVA